MLKNYSPPYYKLEEAKQRCIPNNIYVGEKLAKVPIQDLVDHTAQCLVKLQENVITALGPGESNLEMDS